MSLRNIVSTFALVVSCGLTLNACGSQSDGNKVNANATANNVTPPSSDSAKETLTSSTKGLYNVEINWSPSLEAGTLNNSATVHFHGADGQHVPAVLKSFKLYHSTMGHGSIKGNEMVWTEEEAGHWLVKNIYFSMPGAASSWVVDIIAELNGQSDTARVVIDAEVR